jgi:FkbM family methyltransferase
VVRDQSPTRRRNAIDERNLRVLLTGVLAPDSPCVDVGANVGNVLRMIRDLAPQGRHFAFEALPDLAERLAERFPEVEVHATAVAARSGEATFTRVPSAPALSGFQSGKAKRLETEQIIVNVQPLDELLPHDYRPHLIKVDVEGAELDVFRGAERVLRESRPLVVFEHSNRLAYQYGTTPADVHGVLSGAGLRIFDMDARGPLDLATFTRMYDRHERFNFFARP